MDYLRFVHTRVLYCFAIHITRFDLDITIAYSNLLYLLSNRTGTQVLGSDANTTGSKVANFSTRLSCWLIPLFVMI